MSKHTAAPPTTAQDTEALRLGSRLVFKGLTVFWPTAYKSEVKNRRSFRRTRCCDQVRIGGSNARAYLAGVVSWHLPLHFSPLEHPCPQIMKVSSAAVSRRLCVKKAPAGQATHPSMQYFVCELKLRQAYDNRYFWCTDGATCFTP